MTIKVKITHDKSLITKEARAEFRRDVRGALRGASDILLTEIKRRLGARTGPEPSPEGEAPARRTGKLLRSYRRLAVRARLDVASGGIISKHPGANRLEFGATDTRGVRTLPHPHVRPALAAVEGHVNRYLADLLGAAER
jgi:hypothetical protein